MHEFKESISERRERLFKFLDDVKEEITMSAGDGGFTGDSPAGGPTAGYDKVMKLLRRKKKKKDQED